MPGIKRRDVFDNHLVDPGAAHIQLLAQGVTQVDIQADQLALRVAALEGRELRGDSEADFAPRRFNHRNRINREQQGKQCKALYQCHEKRPFPERPASLHPAPFN